MEVGAEVELFTTGKSQKGYWLYKNEFEVVAVKDAGNETLMIY